LVDEVLFQSFMTVCASSTESKRLDGEDFVADAGAERFDERILPGEPGSM
jgi:hypothetical protein